MAKRRKNNKNAIVTALLAIAVFAAVILAVTSVAVPADKSEVPEVSGDIQSAVSAEVSDYVSIAESIDESIDDTPSAESAESETSTEPQFEPYVITEGLYSSEACLYDCETDTILAVKDADTRMAPASLTKMATVITVIGLCEDYDEMLVCTQDTVNVTYLAGASVVGFLGGEKATVTDMLYGVMLPSGADAAITLAIRFGGSEAGLVEKMNAKMAEIGLTDTHFCNVTGLDEDGHYSTAADMAKLLDYCLDNPLFRQLCTTKTYTIESCTKHDDGIFLTNTAYRTFNNAGIQNRYLKGGKTGTTDAAGRCIAGLCEANGCEYIVVTLGAGGKATDGYVALDVNYIIENILPNIKE